MPEKPHLMTEIDKNLKIDDIETKITNLRNSREKLNHQLSDVMAKLKRQKPD
jgi:chaperonin cofactor prefoldin